MSWNAWIPLGGKQSGERKQTFQFVAELPKETTIHYAENIFGIFPRILDLVYLADDAYFDFEDPLRNPEFPTQWMRVATANCEDGFRAIAYYCPRTTHLVLAFPGTKTGVKAFVQDVFIADFLGVVLSNEVSQIFSALLFTQEVLHRFGKSCISTSITGHSLGGFLAQICTLYSDYPSLFQRTAIQPKLHNRISSLTPLSLPNVSEISPFHLHCVAFESPGCETMFAKILDYKDVMRYNEDKHDEWRKTLDSLDICVILADSNIVNTFKNHLQRIQLLNIVRRPNSRFLSSHGMRGIIKSLHDEESLDIQELHETRLLRQHTSSCEKKIFLKNWYVGRMNSCRINFLTKKEISFLENFLIINRAVHPVGIQCSSKFLANDGDKILRFCNELEIRGITCDVLNRIWIEGKLLSFRDPLETISLFEVISGLKIVFAESPNILEEELLSGRFTNFGIPVLVQSISQEYLRNVPIVKDSGFQFPEQAHCVHIVAGNIPIPLCMAYVAHGLQKLRKTNVMFSNATTLLRWQEALQLEKIFSALDTEVVVVELDSKSETINNLLSKMQDDAQAYKKFLILVTENVCQGSCVAANNSYDFLNFLPESLGQKFTWSELDEKSQDVLWNYQLNMYGNDVEVNHIFGGETKRFETFQEEDNVWLEFISYAFTGKVLEVVQNQNPLQFYMSRQFHNLELDLQHLQNSASEFSEGLYLFVSCTQDEAVEVKSLISPSDKFRLTLLHNGVTKNVFLQSFKNLKNSLTATDIPVLSSQWFHFNDKKFVWQSSALSSCSTLLKCGGEIDESEVFDLESDCLVFADEPGMGKSAFLNHLFFEYNKNWLSDVGRPFRWPIYIDLSSHKEVLSRTNFDMNQTCNFLLDRVLDFKHKLLRRLFEYSFQTLGNFVLFFDSFDELSNDGQKNVLEMLSTIREKHPTGKILVATRMHVKDMLESKLNTVAYRLIPLKRPVQIKFLLERWKLNLLETTSCGIVLKNWEAWKLWLEGFAESVLNDIEKIVGKDDPFVGIPLQLVLLEQVQRTGFENFCVDLVEGVVNSYDTYKFNFESKLGLYKAFTENKIVLYLRNKLKLEAPSNFVVEASIRSYVKLHSLAAMLSLKKSMLHGNCVIVLKEISQVEKEEINRVGICEIYQSEQDSNFRFLHQTLAEYFAALYLANKLKKERDEVVKFLKDHYYEPYFGKVRFFFDSILFVACNVSSIPCLDKLQQKIDESEYSIGEEICQENPAPRDALGRTLLHYAAAYGCLDDKTLWKVVLNKKNLFIQLEDDLDATCFSYTILSDSFQNTEYLRDIGGGEYFYLIMAAASLHTEPSNRYVGYHDELKPQENVESFNLSIHQYIEFKQDPRLIITNRRFPQEWIWLTFASAFVVPFKCNMQWLISNASKFVERMDVWFRLLRRLEKEEDRVNYFFGLFKTCKFNRQNPSQKLLDTLFKISIFARLQMTTERIFELWENFSDFQRLLLIGSLRSRNYTQFLEGFGLSHLPQIIMVLEFMAPMYSTFCPLTVFLCCMFHVGVLYCNETLCNQVRKLLEVTGKDVALKGVWNWNFTRIVNGTLDGDNGYRSASLRTIFKGVNNTWTVKKGKNIPATHVDDMHRIILGVKFTTVYDTFYAELLKVIGRVLNSKIIP